MKVSIDEPDGHKWQPYLDGEKLDDCVAFDTDAGTATVYARNENGRHIIDHDNDELVRKVVTGVVTAVKLP